MSELAAIAAAAADARAELHAAVEQHLASGTPAAAVARVLGVSRQAVQKRYSPAYAVAVSNMRTMLASDRGSVDLLGRVSWPWSLRARAEREVFRRRLAAERVARAVGTRQATN